MTVDIILKDHQPALLEKTFGNHFLYQTENYSLMCEATEIPWLQFIPTQNPEENSQYAAELYGEIHRIANHLKSKGFGPHINIAKIGNKLPYYHIHLVFRNKNDQAWPEPIWCISSLNKKPEIPQTISGFLTDFFEVW